MLLLALVFSTLLRSALCFLWFSECDVIPAPGCTCIGSEGYYHVICNDLDLVDVPQLMELTRIELLDFSANKFTALGDNCFGNGIVTEFILTDNRYQGLNFDDCTLHLIQKLSITHLKLSNDWLPSVPSAIRNMKYLLTLDLSANRIKYIETKYFSRLESLRRLELKGNPIQTVGLVFLSLPGLRELSLTIDRRLIRDVADLYGIIGEFNMAVIKILVTKLTLEDFPIGSANFLRHFSHLESLRLSRCSLEDKAIQTKGKSILRASKDGLQYVDLSDNRLSSFPRRLLYQTGRLVHLDLSSNLIEEINYSCSSHPELRYLDLSKNRIQFLRIGIDERAKLAYLDLSDNQILTIEQDAFKHAHHLEHLDLSGNLLGYLSRASFPDEFPPSLTLHIRKNPLKCDVGCNLQWLVWRIGRQFDTGSGPFSWYDVHNAVCTDALGRHLWLLSMYQSGFKFYPGCDLK